MTVMMSLMSLISMCRYIDNIIDINMSILVVIMLFGNSVDMPMLVVTYTY